MDNYEWLAINMRRLWLCIVMRTIDENGAKQVCCIEFNEI